MKRVKSLIAGPSRAVAQADVDMQEFCDTTEPFVDATLLATGAA